MADYRKVVARSVRRAFRQVGTLAKDVLFSSSQPPTFDFNNATATNGAVTQLILKVVVTDTRKKKEEKSMNTKGKTLMMIAEDVPDLNPVLSDNKYLS